MDTLQPVLQTDRLMLKPVDPVFAGSMLDYQLRNRAHLAPWDPTPGDGYYTESFWAVRLRQRSREWSEGRGAPYLLFLKDAPERVIGTASLSNMVRGVMQGCTMGYGIDCDHQGQGLMREAIEALIRLGFDRLGLHRIQANYQPHNARSAALLARLGFVIEGRASQYLFLNGAWRDHVLTSLINPDFDLAQLPG